MIKQNKPEGSHKTSMNFRTVFSNENNTTYVIKSDLQRRYCWTKNIVNTFFNDYLIDLFNANQDANENGEDNWYGTVDDAIFVKKDGNQMQEIVDSGQRMTTSLSIVCVFIFLILKNDHIDDINEREEIFNKYIKTKNKQHFKLSNTFEDSDLKETVQKLINGTFDTSKSYIQNSKRVFDKGKKGEVVYKQFSSLCALVYFLIEETIGVDDALLHDRLDCFLNNTYFNVEECEEKDRVARFKEVNTNRVEIPSRDIYKSLMCVKGSLVDKKFQEFERHINEITDKNKKIHIIKSPLSPIEYIMRLGIILKDKTKKSCSFYYSLEDENNGIQWHLEHEDGLLYNEEMVLDYLDTCIDICQFLKTSTDFKPLKSYDEDFYMLTEGRQTPYIWLYNILPSYIISKIDDKAKKEFAFDVLLKSYVVYSIKCVVSKSVQYIQPYMYEISKIILEMKDDSYSLDDFKNKLMILYNKTFGDFIRKDLTANIKRLAYNVSMAQGAIFGVLSMIEYYAQKEARIKKENLHLLLTSKRDKKNFEKTIQLDHILPQTNKNENNETEIDSIGNLVLLEGALNASKGKNKYNNSKVYNDSSFVSTKVIMKESRYEFLKNETLNRIREMVLPYSTTVDTINDFTVDDIIERRNAIADKVRELVDIGHERDYNDTRMSISDDQELVMAESAV